MNPTPRILYAEDHEDTRNFIVFLLEQSDFEVVTTDNAAATIEAAEAGRFDLYLLDDKLPDGSGIDICHKIRQFDARTPIIFFSAAAYQSDKQKALDCGAQEYLTKPDATDQLPGTISRLINESRPTAYC